MLNRRAFLVPVLFAVFSVSGALASVETPHPMICGKPLKITRDKNTLAIELEGTATRATEEDAPADTGKVTVSANAADADRAALDGLASGFDTAKGLYLRFCVQDDPSSPVGKRFGAGPNDAEALEELVSR